MYIITLCKNIFYFLQLYVHIYIHEKVTMEGVYNYNVYDMSTITGGVQG